MQRAYSPSGRTPWPAASVKEIRRGRAGYASGDNSGHVCRRPHSTRTPRGNSTAMLIGTELAASCLGPPAVPSQPYVLPNSSTMRMMSSSPR
ncbi:hypothetical protein RHECNPAF_4300127 [Rhizobium etli CNPAF512]|nr:hypothetical protein RHECNPAF_4300127 [Rhizobium etli CNPAF512]